MKKLLIPAILVFVLSCTDSDDPKPAACQPTQVEFFDESSTYFNFQAGTDGFNRISSISVYDGTDSAYQYTYEYTDNRLSNISSNNNFTVNYTPTFDADKLTTLSGRQTGVGIVTEEIRIGYSGNNINSLDYFVADPNSGTLYQYLHYVFGYSNGDLVSMDYKIDLATLFFLYNSISSFLLFK